MAASEPLVTACIIARNEAAHITRCLEQVSVLADELLVGDTGSTDGTGQLAVQAGARVIPVPWEEDFSAARNAVLEEATGKWLFSVDCDEFLRPDTARAARERLADPALPPALLVRIVNRYPGGRQIDMLAPRLFRRDAGFRYVHAVHEQLHAPNADAALTDLTLEHEGYARPGACAAKEERNLAIARGMGETPHGLHCVARAAMALKRWDEVQEACRKLVGTDCGPVLLLEGCALGGGAALAAGDRAGLETFLAIGQSVGADAPDLKLLSVLAAGQEYLESVGRHGLDTPGDYLRSPVFRHDVTGLRAWLGVADSAGLTGGPVDEHGTTSGVPAVDTSREEE